MVHTAIPYASFSSDSNTMNSEGGLWDIFDGNNPPGYFAEEVSLSPLNMESLSGFTGEIYGDVNVNTIGGPGSNLNFLWSFAACGTDSDDNSITTSVGGSSYVDNMPSCVLVPTLTTVTHTGMTQVDSEGNIKIILSVPYKGQGRVNSYVEGFKLQLTLAPQASSYMTTGSSNPIGGTTPETVAESSSQYSSQPPGVATEHSNNSSSSLPTTIPHFSSTAMSTTQSQSYTEVLFSSYSSNSPAIASPPRSTVASPNNSRLAPILGGALAGTCFFALFAVALWRYRRVWRGWKMWEKRKSHVQLNPFFINAGKEYDRRANNSDREPVANDVCERSRGWGRNGLRTMDGQGLEIIEKIRRGVPVAYPLPEYLEIELGEKARGFPFTDENQSRDDDAVNERNLASQRHSIRSSASTMTALNAIIPSSDHLLGPNPLTHPLRRTMTLDQGYILNRSADNSRTGLVTWSQSPQPSDPSQSRLTTLSDPPSLMRRIDLLSGLLHQVLTSGVPSDRTDTAHTHPPPAYGSEEIGRV